MRVAIELLTHTNGNCPPILITIAVPDTEAEATIELGSLRSQRGIVLVMRTINIVASRALCKWMCLLLIGVLCDWICVHVGGCAGR